jgi:aminoglycoside/choline kinase family phosphotransferase
MTELTNWVAQVCPRVAGGVWAPVEHGGSDRRYWRGEGAAAGLILASYGGEKAENAVYARCAEFLRARGVSVPAVLAHDETGRCMLMEDAGREDLWSRRNEPWEQRGPLYRSALDEVSRLHAIDAGDAAAAGVLREPFDAALYRWEQDYFFEHFLADGSAARWRREVPLEKQATVLAALPQVPVHRDFQSQNVMLRGESVALIDFQGMRAGVGAYDVASLVYDPYVELTSEQRAELCSYYAGVRGEKVDEWTEVLRAAARQRLMQALGAYGFLGRVKGKPLFLAHIPAAAERLALLCDEPSWHSLGQAVREVAQHQS